MNDLISMALCRIKNAQALEKAEVKVPASKSVLELVKILVKEGYILSFCKVQDGAKSELVLSLKYYENKPVISEIVRVSKPGLRVYKSAKNLPKVMGGLGVAIVSTSRGLMTDRAARELNLGGEIWCYIS